MLVLEAAASADPDGAAASLTATCVPDLYLVNRGEQAEAAALVLARQLRTVGVSVELDGSGAAFGKQFKRADRCGARWAVVIGDEEAAEAQCLLRPLQSSGEERRLLLKDWPIVVDILRDDSSHTAITH